jgi:hypothetical protein
MNTEELEWTWIQTYPTIPKDYDWSIEGLYRSWIDRMLLENNIPLPRYYDPR